MGEDSGNESSSDSSNDSSSSRSDSRSEALAANKPQNIDDERYQAANSAQKSGNGERATRTNASTKEISNSDPDSTEKSGGKNPSDANEVPSADEVSIPSSVDPDAPANTEGDNSDRSSGSDNSE